MTPRNAFSVVLLVALSLAPAVYGAQGAVTGLPISGDPAVRCDVPDKRFSAWELPFRLPRRLRPNALYMSAPFYAVILRRDSEPDCDGGDFGRRLEAFRLRAQKAFPGRKAFASPQCPDMAAVGYAVSGRPDQAQDNRIPEQAENQADQQITGNADGQKPDDDED